MMKQVFFEVSGTLYRAEAGEAVGAAALQQVMSCCNIAPVSAAATRLLIPLLVDG